MRAAYLGPEGTYTHEAMLASLRGREVSELSLATIHDVVMAVHDGRAQRGIVPIENSVEGSVNATLDALAFSTDDVCIVGETVEAIHHCLIARAETTLTEIETVVSHPQALAQCAAFVREHLPRASVQTAASTAEAVRTVLAGDGPRAALGPRSAARRYGGSVLAGDVEDVAGNETRFAWLARTGAAAPDAAPDAGDAAGDAAGDRFKTAIVFWPRVSDAPGWLVACLSEFARRGVNLTRIESRPLKVGLGEYVFFVDLAGRASDEHVAAGLDGVREHVETLRVLGSFPAA